MVSKMLIHYKSIKLIIIDKLLTKTKITRRWDKTKKHIIKNVRK